MSSRNEKIDFLRFSGLALIIFAHVFAPLILRQPGSFAVPLMVVVSAMSYLLSQGKDKSYLAYFWSRIKRLVFPTWIFLSAYFSVLFLFKIENDFLNLKSGIETYLLLEGIGYVWIIRVFLLVALVAPFLMKFNDSIKGDGKYLLILFGLFILHSITYILTQDYYSDDVYKYFFYIVGYIVPYSLIFAFGLRFESFSANMLKIIVAVCFALFVAVGALHYIQEGQIQSFYHYKYPPQAFYILYSMVAVIIFYGISGYVWPYIRKITAVRNVVLFSARNSLWIYLWHIPIVTFLDINFMVEYIITFAGAVLVTFLQVKLLENVIVPKVKSKNLQYNLKIMLRG